MDQNWKNEVGGECRMYRGEREGVKVLVGKTEGKGPLERGRQVRGA
jgi:hypothetical protein